MMIFILILLFCVGATLYAASNILGSITIGEENYIDLKQIVFIWFFWIPLVCVNFAINIYMNYMDGE